MTILFFRNLARFVSFCERKFYNYFPSLLRKRQSKGYGVHSPFAFDLITNVIYSNFSFYAFSDIPLLVSRSGIDPNSISAFNRLSFRLIYYLKSKNILEINSGNGVNTLFLTAPSSQINCICVEDSSENIAVAKKLHNYTGGAQLSWQPDLSGIQPMKYDIIFINLHDDIFPEIDFLMNWSHANTCWVFHPIKNGKAKLFWTGIVNDERTRITFDTKDTGIVFLRPDYHKVHYLV